LPETTTWWNTRQKSDGNTALLRWNNSWRPMINEASFVYLQGLWSVGKECKLILFQSWKCARDGGTVQTFLILVL
jgi:hypothetical protein